MNANVVITPIYEVILTIKQALFFGWESQLRISTESRLRPISINVQHRRPLQPCI